MLNVLYQFNEKYVPFAGTSIVSLLENNKSVDDITIYVLCEDVLPESKLKLKTQIDEYGRNSVFIDAVSIIEKMKKLGINDYRGSYATNIKMFVTEFIPINVERLLYIDSDTIICGNLGEVLEFDMKGNPVAMCQDSLCKNHKKSVGFSKEDKYFNGGIMLFEMKEWRALHCTERICEHLKNDRSFYMAPDQDLINIVLKNQIAQLPISYNLQPIHLVYKYSMYKLMFGQPCYYSEQEVEAAIQKPVIYHTFRYLGEFPWHKGNLHPNTPMFDKYLAISKWNDYEKVETERNDIVFKIERMLYRMLPKGIFILIFKACYEIFLWKSNRDAMVEKNNVRM